MTNAFTSFVADVLAYSLWQGAIVLALVLAALGVGRRVGIRTRSRYVVLCGALAIYAVAPTVTVLVHRTRPTDPPTAAADHAGTLSQSIHPLQVNPPAASSASLPFRLLDISRLGVTAEGLSRARIAIVALWSIGALAGLMRFAGKWLAIQRIVRAASPPDSDLAVRARTLAHHVRVRGEVDVRVSSAVRVPFAAGFRRPVIVLPHDMQVKLGAAHADAILVHELAHVRRRDYVVGLSQALVTAMVFYHPVTWWLDRQVRLERECCTDAEAAAVVGDRVRYARALAELEQWRSSLPALGMHATDGSLVMRIERLIGAVPTRQPIAVVSTLAILSALLGAAVSHRADAATVVVARSTESLVPQRPTRVDTTGQGARLRGILRDTAETRGILRALASSLSVYTVGVSHSDHFASVHLENWRRTDLTKEALTPVARRAITTLLTVDRKARTADTLSVIFSDQQPRVVTLEWSSRDFREHPDRVRFVRPK